MDYSLILAVWFVCGVLSAVIANVKGNNTTAAFSLGFLFGPLGVLFALLQKRKFRVEAVPWEPPK